MVDVVDFVDQATVNGTGIQTDSNMERDLLPFQDDTGCIPCKKVCFRAWCVFFELREARCCSPTKTT